MNNMDNAEEGFFLNKKYPAIDKASCNIKY